MGRLIGMRLRRKVVAAYGWSWFRGAGSAEKDTACGCTQVCVPTPVGVHGCSPHAGME